MCRGVSHTPFTLAKMYVSGEHAGIVCVVFWLQSFGNGSLLLHCSPIWGRMRYAPTLVRLKWCGEHSLLLHCSLMWGRMRYAPTLVRLKSCVENLWLLLVCPGVGVCDTSLRLLGEIFRCKNNGRPMSFCGHGPPVCLLSCLRFLKAAYSVTSDSTGSLTGSSEATGSSVAGTSESVALFLRNVVTRLSSVFRFSR